MSVDTGRNKMMLPHLGFILVYLIFGMNMGSMKIGGREWDPLMFNGLRYAIAALLIWSFALMAWRKDRRRLRLPGKDLRRIMLLGVLSAVGMEAMQSYALQYSNAANAAVLGRGLMPMVTILLMLAMRRICLTRRLALGLPFAFVSVMVIVAGGEQGLHFGLDTLRGDVLLLLRSLFGAVYLIGVSRLTSQYPLLPLMTWEITAGALSMLPYVLWKADAAFFANMSQVGWASLMYTTFMVTLAGFTLHNWCLSRIGPVKSSIYGYMLPVVAAAAGYFMLGESLNLYQIVGGVGVLTAMFMVQRDRMQTVNRQRQEHAGAPAANTRGENTGQAAPQHRTFG